MDNITNFSFGILTAGIDATQLTAQITLGANITFPASNYNAVIWDASQDMLTARINNLLAIYRVLTFSAGTLTFKANLSGNREAQEGTTAIAHNTNGHTYNVALCVTAKMFQDIIDELAAKANKTQVGNDAAMVALAATLGSGDAGLVDFFNTEQDSKYTWNGTTFV